MNKERMIREESNQEPAERRQQESNVRLSTGLRAGQAGGLLGGASGLPGGILR